MSFSNSSSSIIKTVIYADIFDFPLTESEIKSRLVSLSTTEKDIKNINNELSQIHFIENYKGYYFIKGKQYYVEKRNKRKNISDIKLKIALKYSYYLSFIPFISYIGASGSLAYDNCMESDDIDIFLITNQNTLWITRFLAIAILEFFRVRRRPNDLNVKDKICLNMIVEENVLTIAKKFRCLFTAYEVLFLKKLFDRNNCYLKFLKANAWIKEYLYIPYTEKISKYENINKTKKNYFGKSKNKNYFLNNLNKTLKLLQLEYMRSKITIEKIEDNIIMLHRKDYRNYVQKEYEANLNFFGIKNDLNNQTLDNLRKTYLK